MVASPLRAALAQNLGHPIAASVVYRMRHGWRKVALDTRHPKIDPLLQWEWKKPPGTLGAFMKSGDVKGRMVRIRRCWAPSPKRPQVCNG